MSHQSLAPILRFVLANREWADTDRLERLADCLPAVATAGLEIPLQDSAQADLQQRICKGPQAERLRHWLQTTPSHEPAWRRLDDALSGGVLDDFAEEIWLELDDAETDTGPPLSVFIRLPEGEAAEAEAQDTEALIARGLQLFGHWADAGQWASVRRCISACGANARITFLGLMLGRSGSPLRLIVDRLPPDELEHFLIEAGWPGPMAEAQALAERLFVHADRVRLALTVHSGLTDDIGFECFVGEPQKTDPRWQCFLDDLAAMGLCAPALADRLLAWPCRMTPADGSGWPEALLVEALARGPDQLGSIDCQLSHVKVSFGPSRPLGSKAYFGFVEVWDDLNRNAPAPASIIPSPPKRDIDAGIEAAAEFLLSARNQAGWWLDYDGFSEGPADEWVTAYVANALCDLGTAPTDRAVRRAERLLSLRARDGWGWNYLQPADADSTIWALRLALRLGHDEAAHVMRGMAFLGCHQGEGGGVATYRRGDYQAWANIPDINRGWYETHECVTAAAGGLGPLAPSCCAYLRASQRPDGAWSGYWWSGEAYTTALAAEALAKQRGPDDLAALSRAGIWVEDWFRARSADDLANVSPFELALMGRVLLAASPDQAGRIATARDALLATQQADGGWAGSAELSIPSRKGEIVPALDNRRTLTTATALQMLLTTRRQTAGG